MPSMLSSGQTLEELYDKISPCDGTGPARLIIEIAGAPKRFYPVNDAVWNDGGILVLIHSESPECDEFSVEDVLRFFKYKLPESVDLVVHDHEHGYSERRGLASFEASDTWRDADIILKAK